MQLSLVVIDFSSGLIVMLVVNDARRNCPRWGHARAGLHSGHGDRLEERPKVALAQTDSTAQHSTQHTGAGEDNGVDHNQNWLRFPYVFIFSRSHYLPAHPYECYTR
jgi:hypothetical protein